MIELLTNENREELRDLKKTLERKSHFCRRTRVFCL